MRTTRSAWTLERTLFDADNVIPIEYIPYEFFLVPDLTYQGETGGGIWCASRATTFVFLRKTIASHLLVSSTDIRLFFSLMLALANRSDEKTVKEAGIGPGSTFHVIIALRG